MRRIIMHSMTGTLKRQPVIRSDKARVKAQYWPVALSLGAVACLGLYAWHIISERNQKWLETMDLDRFNPVQLEVWKRCNALYDRLEMVHRKLEEFDGPGESNRYQLARSLYIPQTCIFLEEQRAVSRRERTSDR
jgi:hypothetical protein